MAPSVRAVPVRGLDGDRYFLGRGSLSRWPGPGRAVSFIAAEALAVVLAETGIDLHEGRHRRNIVTVGVDLDALRTQRFRIGTALFRGRGGCQPCGYLERLTVTGACAALKGRGGLRAEVLEEGVLAPGDSIVVVDDV